MSKPPCDVCQLIYERKGAEPPCLDCSPIMYSENEEAFGIFPIVYNQILFAGMGEPIGLNLIAVKAVFDIMKVENQKECLMKILVMFDHYFEKIKEKKNG